MAERWATGEPHFGKKTLEETGSLCRSISDYCWCVVSFVANAGVCHRGKAQHHFHDVYTGKAGKFIQDCHSSRTPFFVYLAFFAPHAPATPAPRHAGLFQDARVPRTPAFNEADVSAKPQFIRDLPPMTSKEVASADAYYGKRLASLQAVDEAIDTICQTLAKTGQLDNTYIAFASDNGFHLGEHRLIRGKRSAYQTDTHVPLIVRGPGIAKGTTISALAGNIDLAPTFADLVGAAVPKFIDGRSLAAILKGRAGKNWRQAFLIEQWQQDVEPNIEKSGAEITLGRKFEAMVPQYKALQRADNVFVQYVSGEREYYNLFADASQVNNLSGSLSKEQLNSKTAYTQKLAGSAGDQARRLESLK